MKTTAKKVTRKPKENTVEMLFTKPEPIFRVCFPIITFPHLIDMIPAWGLTMNCSDAKLFLEHISGSPEKPYDFDSDIALYEKLCEVIFSVDNEDIEVTACMITDQEEKARFRAYLTEYFIGRDVSRY